MTGAIDVHTHFLPSSLVRFLERREEIPRIHLHDGRRGLEYAPGVIAPLARSMEDLDEKLATLDDGGIATALLSVATVAVDLWGERDAIPVARAVNDELAQIASDSGGRLEGIALLPMADPDGAAAELERAGDMGLRGGIVESNVGGRALDEAPFDSVFAIAARRGLPLLLHPNTPRCRETTDDFGMLPVVGYLFDTTVAALRLIFSGLYERHSNLKLVLCHSGSLIPPLAGRLDEFFAMGRMPSGSAAGDEPPSAYVRRLYVDTVCASGPALRLALELFGADRIMFGTDHPYFGVELAGDTLAAAGLTEDEHARVMRGTAERVYAL